LLLPRRDTNTQTVGFDLHRPAVSRVASSVKVATGKGIPNEGEERPRLKGFSEQASSGWRYEGTARDEDDVKLAVA
jgi:hypothetical protein